MTKRMERQGMLDRRAVILGIDGAPYSLLRHYMAMGIMPHLSSLCESGGTLRRMDSSIPEVSSVAWTNFMTGANPGEHGIFGFMEIDPQSYQYQFPNFLSLKAPPIWEKWGVRTIAFNIPQTYPARPMDGVLVSGFVALDLKKAVYPETVYNHLSSTGYRLDVNMKLALQNPGAFFEDMFSTYEKRVEAIEWLYDHEPWQLFIGVITETDRLHHFFFRSAREGEHFDVFRRFYQKLDTFIGKMASKAASDGAVFLTCSDHGFTPLRTEVFLNRWLMDKGFLKLNGGQGLTGITPDSRAFCLDPSRLYVHLESRYGRGKVPSGHYDAVLDELTRNLQELSFEGSPVVRKFFRKKDIYFGDQADRGPDLCLIPHDGFDLKGAVERPAVFGTGHFQGMHTHHDAHLFTSFPLEDAEVAIQDIPRIVAGACGSPESSR